MLLVMTLLTLARRLKNTVTTAAGTSAPQPSTLTIPGRVTTTGVPTGTVVGIDYLVASALSTFPPSCSGLHLYRKDPITNTA